MLQKLWVKVHLKVIIIPLLTREDLLTHFKRKKKMEDTKSHMLIRMLKLKKDQEFLWQIKFINNKMQWQQPI